MTDTPKETAAERYARGMVLCPNGHWYGPNTYKPPATTCPVCQVDMLRGRSKRKCSIE